MSNLIRHPYHLVDESPWPILSGAGGMFLTSGLLVWFHYNDLSLFCLALVLLVLVSSQWWRNISHEGKLQGHHTAVVELGLRWGMVLFIISEIFFFLSFFWAFFHSSLVPTGELGSVWPPSGILSFNAFQVPLLNTLVLVSSGVSVTWAHHSLIAGNFSAASQGLILTILLGMYFTFLQAFEYYEASFSFADGAYGSTFFLGTGFHGLHVLVGTLFLLICWLRHLFHSFSASHHFGLEAAAWYWHFVDVVWLFLFVSFYWWGGL